MVDAPSETRKLASTHGLPPVHVRVDGKSFYGEMYERETTDWVDGVYQSSTALLSQDPELGEISKYIRLLSGSHWTNRPSYRSTFTVNKLLSFFYQQLALLSDVRMNTSIETDNPELRSLAQNLTRLAYANFTSQDGDIALLYTLMHASLTGIGYTKIGF